MSDARLVCRLPALPPGTHVVDEVLVHIGRDGTARASSMRCAHQNARLGRPAGCVLTCGLHGWRLDASTMQYLPPNSRARQPEYEVRRTAEGWDVLRVLAPPPWAERQPRRGLFPGVFTVVVGETEATVYAGGPPLRWAAGARPVHLDRWATRADGSRSMWLAADGGPALLVELAGHRVLIAGGPLETAEPPVGLDVVVAFGPVGLAAGRVVGPGSGRIDVAG